MGVQNCGLGLQLSSLQNMFKFDTEIKSKVLNLNIFFLWVF